MFDLDIPVVVKQPTQIATNRHHERVKIYRLKFETEMTDDVASFSDFARQARKALVSGESTKTEIDISGVDVHLELKDCERPIKIKSSNARQVKGVKAVGKMRAATKKREASARLTLTFESPWTDDLVLACAYNCDDNATLRIVPHQPKLPKVK